MSTEDIHNQNKNNKESRDAGLDSNKRTSDEYVDKYSIDNTDYTIGQDNVQKWGFDVHNSVFMISAGLIILFLIIILSVDPDVALATLNGIRNSVISRFDVLFMLACNFFIIFCLAIIVSPFGKIRLGGDDAKPEHSYLSWFSMLFAAGIGIGLMFWGVAEPAAYFTGVWGSTPLNVEANSAEAASLALGATLFHWGFQPWAMYAVVALSLAFFTFNKGLPLSFRSVFYPLLGERVWGWPGHIIDITAVLATLFGLVTSLGLGAQQAASGISHVFGIENGVGLSIIIVVAITLLAIFSVVRGIDGGVKLISNINMVMAFGLLVVVFIMGFTVAYTSIFDMTISYVTNAFALANPFGREDVSWMHDWTVFYWAWWISWSPFVGMFIARVSRGRTIREFLLSLLIVPSIVIMIWMGTFGGIGIDQLRNKIGILGEQGFTNLNMALFEMFSALPFTQILSVVSIVLILVFFVSSSDSGSLVIDSITAGGKLDAPVAQRVFWAAIEGAVAIVLLYVSGENAIKALQAGTISTALPFVFILIAMCFSLVMGLRTEPRSR